MGRLLVIVDDEETDRYLVQRVASKVAPGLQTIEFPDGVDFIEALENEDSELNKLAETHSSLLVLLDINMPGMTGFEVVAKVREGLDAQKLAERSMVIMICSSSDHDRDQKAAAAEELIQDYIVKPMTRDKLTKIITEHC